MQPERARAIRGSDILFIYGFLDLLLEVYLYALFKQFELQSLNFQKPLPLVCDQLIQLRI